MIITDSNVLSVAVGRPFENNSPLIVYANRIKTFQLSAKWLEPIRRRKPQVEKRCRKIKLPQLVVRALPNLRRERAFVFLLEKSRRRLVRKTFNHDSKDARLMIPRQGTNSATRNYRGGNDARGMISTLFGSGANLVYGCYFDRPAKDIISFHALRSRTTKSPRMHEGFRTQICVWVFS